MRLLLALLAVFAFLGGGVALAQTTSFDLAMSAIVSRPQLQHALVAAEVYDLDAQRPVYRHNASTLMEAASTTKLLTEGTTLALLGPSFAFTTNVYRTGPIDAGGTLQGNVVLVASGDPNLSQRMQPDGTLAFENEDHSYDGSYETRAVPGDPLAAIRDIAAQIAKSGVKRIEGGVVVDTALFPDQGPENGTGAVVSSIAVNDNLVDVTVTPGAKAGDPITINVSPQSPYVTFVTKATTGASGVEPTIDMSGDVTNSNGTHTVTITGTQPLGAPMLYAYRVPEPKAFAEAVLTVALTDAGVQIVPVKEAPFAHDVAAPSYTASNLVAQHESVALAEDVKVTLKVSDNLHAALMPYLWATYVARAKSDFLKAGFAQERQLLTGAGLDVRGASQTDGLGSFAFFTPDFMVHYLSWAHAQAWYPTLLHSLPVLGVDGTLFNIQTTSPAKGKVFAKTGTWSSGNALDDGELVTKGLAGFMTTSHGRHLAFAFYINRMAGKPSVDLSKDAAHAAGELLGSMATAAYESL